MISIRTGDITKVKADALVNPSNSSGSMGGGVALAIKRAGGIEIEKEAMKKAPIHVGSAVATTGGRLKSIIIHASTMERPAEKTGAENVRKAMRAALQLIGNLGLKTAAFPGMGTGVGGVSYEEAARVMIEEARKYPDLDAVFVAYNERMENIFREVLE